MADLERAALSGELFQPRPTSPARSASSASLQSLNTEDELGSDLSDSGPSRASRALLARGERGDGFNAAGAGDGAGATATGSSTEHDGPQTGPKGVISDRRARSAADQASARDRREATRRAQGRRAIVGATVEEEDAMRRAEANGAGMQEEEREQDREERSAREAWRAQRRDELAGRGQAGDGRGGGKGLREVGEEGFVSAVERTGWVVVLIYEPVCPPSPLGHTR